MGGFTTGGLNFDAKVRRQSHEPVDLLYAHIGGMDAFARGLEIAHAIREDGRLAEHVRRRYQGWDTDLGRKILSGELSMQDCASYARSNPEPTRVSGRQEYLENMVNEFIL
jgi:xylose isomerase